MKKKKKRKKTKKKTGLDIVIDSFVEVEEPKAIDRWREESQQVNRKTNKQEPPITSQ